MTKHLFILLLGTFFLSAARAVDEPPLIAPLEGRLGQLKSGAIALVQDTDFYADLQRDRKKIADTYTRNIVCFSIDEASRLFLKSPFQATLVYRLYFSFKNNPYANDSLTEDQTMIIDYDTAQGRSFNVKKSFVFENAVKVKVKIVGITTNAEGWDPVPSLRLTNELQVKRIFIFDCEESKVPQISFVQPTDNDADELKVFWQPVGGADEYDLEWTYIDQSAYAAGTYGTPGSEDFKKKVFKNNATRVTLNSTMHHYSIPLLFDKLGWLLFRVRSVQVKSSGQRTEANWSNYNSFEFVWGHQANLNWQASTSFAEEGRRKTVLQYFDGSLRSRQTVTKDNTENATVVAETFYDYQGRPAIQVLPAPTLNMLIKHTPNFNGFLNPGEYYKDNYDRVLPETDYCNSATKALDPASGGAAQYYSSQNSQKEKGNNKLIPDAKGFPFSETRYTRDNTGRIAAQGGVGPDHQLATGHETQYYYGNPDQVELDALFGTEAGDASHYFKNMVRDANGQYSVSYLDMHGRTVATALAGDLPADIKLDYLTSKEDNYLTKSLTDASNNIVKGLTIESSKGLLVAKTGNHRFSYSLLPENVNLKDCNDASICYTCSYTIEITISDDCGNKQFGGSPFTYTDVIGGIDADCIDVQEMFIKNFDKILQEGSYTITKKLTIRDEALQVYREDFTGTNVCKTVQDFVEEQKQIFFSSTNNCASPCYNCERQLGTSQQAFIDKFITDNGLNINLASDRQLAITAYAKLFSQCEELCDRAKTKNYLNSLRMLMLQDVTPPYGQYANVEDYTGTGDNREYYENGIFGPISTGNRNYRYTIASLNYKDENGDPATVTLLRDGSWKTLKPQQLTIEEFVSYFQPSWAETLADNLHPERMQYNILNTTAAFNDEPAVGNASYDWDVDFSTTETFAEAQQRGFLNPTNNIAFASRYTTAFNGNSVYADPFFVLHSSLRNQMHSFMQQVAAGGGYAADIWNAASIAGFCAEQGDQACLQKQITDPFSKQGCAADLDMAWRAFRAMYKSKKEELILAMVKGATGSAPIIDETKYRSYFTRNADAIQNGTGITDIHSKNEVSAALQKFYTDQSSCAGYAELWWQKLTPCDIQKLMPYKAQLLADLVTVCTKGTDETHAMGASSIAPEAINSFRDFDEVLAYYIQLYNAANPSAPIGVLDCNGSLLNFPAPYTRQQVLADKPIVAKPEPCECEKITALHNAYLQQSRDLGFSDYIKRTLHTVISNGSLDTLLSLCSGSIDCKFISAPVHLPPALQCGVDNACVSCIVVREGFDAFATTYYGIMPRIEETSGEQQKINALFAHYMNKRFGFAKTAQEYLLFMADCLTGTADNVPGSLAESVDKFNRDVNPLRVLAALQSNSLSPTVYERDITQSISDGMLRWPEAIRDTAIGYFEYFQHVLAGSSYCSGNGYAVEFKFKFLKDDISPNQEFFYYTDGNGGFVLYRRKTGPVADQGTFLGRIRGIDPVSGKAITVNTESSLISADPDLIFKEWTAIRFEFSGGYFSVYANNTLLRKTPRTSVPLKNIRTFTLSFMHFQAALDWTKIYDHTGKLVFFDDYLTSATRQTIIPSFACPKPAISCEQSFTNYFNEQRGTRYTYEQIAALYNDSGVILKVCTDSIAPVSFDPDLLLCGKNKVSQITMESRNGTPCADSLDFAISRGYERYMVYRDSVRGEATKTYLNKCLQAAQHERFTVQQPVSEYHYTLFYYDQAGNLVKTIPPKGVHPNYDAGWLQSVKNSRDQNAVMVPDHGLAAQYRYNTLNQVVHQKTPDAGQSRFWYDRLGRLAVSQNAKQAMALSYSYTCYDYLGRIAETGQISNASQVMTTSISRNPVQLQSWMRNNVSGRSQVTATFYDLPAKESYLHKDLSPYIMDQCNLRNRVAFTLFDANGDISNYDYAAFYQYDIAGNVDTLLQDYGAAGFLAQQGNRYKRIAYGYDLISSKINTLSYQPRLYDPVTKQYIVQPDAFFHQYSYDAENRLTDVFTSADEVHWEHDAHYQYYRHGPLSRAVIGENQVQAIDYAYTLQGWLKGVNGTTTEAAPVAGDAYHFNLHYYSNDYTAIGEPQAYSGLSSNLALFNAYKPLYNGNISSMGVYIGKLSAPLLYNYRYDQLNRITGMDAYSGSNAGNNIWDNGLSATQNYRERISYDANGNILTYDRNGFGSSDAMDELTYYYQPGSNKLDHVKDEVPSFNYTEDTDNQQAGNYDYDETGNLIKDRLEGIDDIEWTVYGKIKTIAKANGETIEYAYDAAGNRISKTVTKSGTITTILYVRDASGKILAVYGIGSSDNKLFLNEQHIYGSNRLGIYNAGKDLSVTPPSPINMGYGNSGSLIIFERGKKFFELSNHLGNVLATVSDKKKAHDAGNGTIDYYEADVVNAQDYYPFGMRMPGRIYEGGNHYRYGFNGKEMDRESPVQYDYGFRIYDPRLAKFKSVDPLTHKYPELTPYQFASNRPVDGVDLDGLEYVSFHHYTNGTVTKTEFYKMTDKDIKKLGGTTAGIHNSAPYGPEGRGIVHYYYDDSGNRTDIYWEQRQIGGISDFEFHGLYSGGGSVTYDGFEGSTNYDFTQQPIDWADAIAKRHDIDYAAAASENYAGYLEDVRTLQADRDMVSRIDNLIAKNWYKIRGMKLEGPEGVETPVRTTASTEFEGSLYGQRILINALATYKQWKIDNNLSNDDKYKINREAFENAHPGAALILDQTPATKNRE